MKCKKCGQDMDTTICSHVEPGKHPAWLKDLIEVRNKFYDGIPAGNISALPAWEWIQLIKWHINDLDNLMQRHSDESPESAPQANEGKDLNMELMYFLAYLQENDFTDYRDTEERQGVIDEYMDGYTSSPAQEAIPEDDHIHIDDDGVAYSTRTQEPDREGELDHRVNERRNELLNDFHKPPIQPEGGDVKNLRDKVEYIKKLSFEKDKRIGKLETELAALKAQPPASQPGRTKEEKDAIILEERFMPDRLKAMITRYYNGEIVRRINLQSFNAQQLQHPQPTEEEIEKAFFKERYWSPFNTWKAAITWIQSYKK